MKKEAGQISVWVAVSADGRTFYLNTVSATRDGAKHWQQVVNGGAGKVHRATLTLSPPKRGKK